MLSVFSRKKELKVRQAILRGVYEDNLKIIGLKGGSLTRQRPFFLRRTFLFFFVPVLIVLLYGSHVPVPFVPEHQVTATAVTHRTSSHPPAAPFNPSEYKAFISDPEMSLSRTFGLGVRTILIDPGHGGADCGATGKMGTKEKDITLDIAMRLKERLIKQGRFNVRMTREQDVTLPLNKRVELARANKADLFISIHLNYLPSKPINIIETYYFGHSSDAKTLKLAEQENAGSEYGLSDFREMIEKLGEKLKLQESNEFASSIQKNLYQNIRKENGNAYNFGVKRAPFVVLLGVEVPAVLAEVSCLSNGDEEAKLNTENYRENIARYLEAGILDYLHKGEASHEASRSSERR